MGTAHIGWGTFTTLISRCPQVNKNNHPIPVKTEVKYLGLHLDEKLTSKLSLENKLIIYKHILKPVWTYGIEL
jgi:hypothetical protein